MISKYNDAIDIIKKYKDQKVFKTYKKQVRDLLQKFNNNPKLNQKEANKHIQNFLLDLDKLINGKNESIKYYVYFVLTHEFYKMLKTKNISDNTHNLIFQIKNKDEYKYFNLIFDVYNHFYQNFKYQMKNK